MSAEQNMEDKVREALLVELERQAEGGENPLKFQDDGEGRLKIDGVVDIEALSLVVVETLAGSP